METEDKYRYKFANYEPSDITIYNHERKVLFRDSSLVAVRTEDYIIAAVGNEAQSARGHVGIAVGSPLRNGIVADFEMASNIFKYFLKKSGCLKPFIKPKIAVCVQADMTQVEYRALYELIIRVGAKNVLIFEETFERAVQYIPDSYKVIIEISHDMSTE